MARKRSVDKVSFWQAILDRQAASGLSIRRFCAREGVSQPSFYAWRKKLGARDKDGAAPGKAILRRDASNNGRVFVPLQLLDAAQLSVTTFYTFPREFSPA